MSETILKINGLSKSYGKKQVLKNVTFSVEKGKIYGFIGENGAGKTTTIRAVTGLTAVEDGQVELFGKSDAKGLSEGRKKMGCLVEHPIISLNKTAHDNLAMQQLLYGQDDASRIDRLLERVGLSDVKNKKVKDFSLGMKQRLGIAVSLINDPELLILDEPVNGLDPVGMVEVRELLRSLAADDGITIVISSHILAELYQLVTDYIIISHGEILETISKEELDAKCASYVTLETDRTEAALEVLKNNGASDIGFEGNIIRIYDDVSLRTVATWMFDARILVTLLARHERSLENYYMELLGRA
ncbi:ABC transporter ATP-binding protein [Butyrivibrio sp. AE2032]|uniref:ABC transporter ATP-binding protein n=1 Tax=Butyrivibrio sp. AE2032 TaxID=1458463 RepID=UPI0005527936|nr:ATP-binding cassette domain-containing protein [Butyrivibrio sp. AE2032]